MREYRASKPPEQNYYLPQVNDVIPKFHRIVSNGLVYVCSCFYQLWYRHSAFSTAKLRERGPNVDKY